MVYATKNNGIKKERTRDSRVPESKKVELEKNETYVGPSVGTSAIGKKSVAKIKSLRRKHVQASKDWVSFLASCGRFGQ